MNDNLKYSLDKITKELCHAMAETKSDIDRGDFLFAIVQELTETEFDIRDMAKEAWEKFDDEQEVQDTFDHFDMYEDDYKEKNNGN